MDTEIVIVKKNVDLEGYSSSPGFLGYCEPKLKISLESSRHIINLLLREFNLISKENKIVSSLHFDKDDLLEGYEISEEKYKKYYRVLLNGNIAVKVNFAKLSDDYSSIEHKLKLQKLMNAFRSIEITTLDLLKIAFLVIMTLGGLKGHLFVVLKNESLIIYPHDDGGFGFISYGPSRPYLQEQLKTRLKAMFEDEPNIVIHVWDEEKGAYY